MFLLCLNIAETVSGIYHDCSCVCLEITKRVLETNSVNRTLCLLVAFSEGGERLLEDVS